MVSRSVRSLRVFVRERWDGGVVLLLMLAWFVPIGWMRVIDGDEGYLLYAARLLNEGFDLYTDFFFPQTPVIPTAFSYWFRLTGPGWHSARVLASIVAALSGLLVYALAQQYSQSKRIAALAAILFAACGYSFGWLPIAKTYGFATFFSLLGIWLLERGSRATVFMAGLSIVLALESRLYVGVIALNAIVYVVRRAWSRRAAAPWLKATALELSLLAAGAVVGLSLLVPPFYRDFETALFGIFEFAAVRFPGQTTLFGSWDQKYVILLAELGITGQDGSGSVQLLFLCLLALLAFGLSGLRSNRLTASVWPVLLMVNLLPAVTFTQYVCLCVPFVAVEAALALSTLKIFTMASGWRQLASFSAFLAAYLAIAALDVIRFCVTGALVPGVNGHPPPWDLNVVEQVAKDIDAYNYDEVVSFWPGYFVSSRTRVIPELANHFGFHVSGRYDDARMQRLHLISNQQMAKDILRARYPLIVDGNWSFDRWKAQTEAKYRLDKLSTNVKLWRPKSSAPASPQAGAQPR